MSSQHATPTCCLLRPANHSADLHSPSASLLCHLPSSLFHLILCFLPLDDKLNHCSHLSNSAPPLSPAALRYDELQLTATSVTQLLRSPHLLHLFSQLSNLSCSFDEWVTVPTFDALGAVMPYGVSELKLPDALFHCPLSHFSALTRLSIHCPPYHIRPTQQVRLPSLGGSESSIRSLSFTSTSLDTSSSWLLSTISPLLALRNLYLAVALHPDCLHLLLQRRLHTLDLSGSRLTSDATPSLPDSGWRLATTCRVLRLPTSRYLVSDYYLDSIVERWPAEVAAVGRRLDALAIQHVMSESAVEAVLALPAPHNLSVAIEGHKADLDCFLPATTSLPQLNSPNLHLRVAGRHWRNVEKLQVCLDLLTRHATHIRSVDVTLRRQPTGQTWLTQKLLAALSHCSRLQSVVVDGGGGGEVNHRSPVVEQQRQSLSCVWAQQIWLLQLRSVSVANVAEADLCRLLAASPSLDYCSVELLTVSHGILALLATSCPTLTSLHVRSKRNSPHPFEDDEKQQQQHSVELVPFRSLTSLTVPANVGWLGRKAAVSAHASIMQSLLAGSPVKRLQLVHWYTDERHVKALLPVLLSLPHLQVLLLCDGDGTVEPPSAAMWDAETSLEEDEQPTLAFQHSPLCNVQPPLITNLTATSTTSASPLRTLELSVPVARLSLTSIATLLAHTPHLTAITVAVTTSDSTASLANCILHILGLLGVHAPLIESIQLASDRPPPSVSELGCVLDVAAVCSVVGQYELPTAAFGRLRRVQQVELRGVLAEERRRIALISGDAMDWLYEEWFKLAPLHDKQRLVQCMEAFEWAEQ